MANTSGVMDVDDTVGPEVEASPAPLFHDVFFTIVPGDLLVTTALDLQKKLEDNGAHHVPFDAKSNTIKPLTEVSHIIAATSDFPQYEDAMDQYIHVVKPSWVQHSINKGKQSNPRQYSPDPRLFFSDVVISCGEIPEGDKEAIAGGTLAMGGLYSENLSKLSTHLIALSVDDERAKRAVLKNLKVKIILPHWFDDCLRLGKRISESPYLLPNPEVLSKHEKPPAQRTSSDVVGATAPHPIDHLPSPSPSSDGTRCLDVFNGKTIMFSEDLDLGVDIKKTLSDLVIEGGGNVVDVVGESDIYICRYRDGRDYILASQNKVEVANLAWLYFLITNNRWTSPLRRLLHYPIPRDGVPGFQDTRISVSNYSGEARIYLENLIRACGAEFTKSMHNQNTHLITAHMKSEKCDAALEWNIAVVNHQWIEDSYVRYQLQSLSVKRYTEFPERINLGEVIGRTPLDRLTLQKHFFPLPKPGRKKAKADVDEEALQGANEPQTSTRKGRRSNADAQLTPALRKFVDTGKENQTPGSGRSAKIKALSKLHDSAPDIQKFEKEMKRRGGVTHGRERRASTADVATPTAKGRSTEGTPASRGAKDKALSKLQANALDIEQYEKERKRKGGVLHGKGDEEEKVTRGKKRQSIEIEDDDDTEDEGQDEQGSSAPIIKNGKRRKSGGESHRLVLTSYARWQDNPKIEFSERNTLRNLGIHITEDTSKAEILCAPKILRTPKFVCAMANAPYVVSSAFLDYCINNKKMPDPQKYLLNDRDAEERMGFKLAASLERATRNNHKLLDTWQVYCTEQIKGGFDTFKQIVEANGGACLRYQGRVQVQVRKRKRVDGDAESQEEEVKERLYLLSGETPAERAMWPKFRQMAAKADMVPVITKSDWLLNLAMSQEITWDQKWLLEEA